MPAGGKRIAFLNDIYTGIYFKIMELFNETQRFHVANDLHVGIFDR
jgi:hypothetical protein